MKKRAVASIMSLMMAMSLMAGCGESADSAASAPAESAEAAESSEAAESAAEETGESVAAEAGAVYKVGIVQYVDDASLNQIEQNIEAELDAKGAELGVTFDYADYTFNGQADATTLNQIAAELVADEVDVIVPIATPTAVIMQAATEDNQIPVVFSAVSDPVTAGLVESLDAPGSNVTGTSDALNTKVVMDLMFAANPDITKVGLLYNSSEDASKVPVADAKAYCEEKGVEVIEKTGTTVDEVALAADALVADGVEAVFTPTDNTIMTAELSIYEKFIEAGIPHYAGADSFALNGAFVGYGVNYADLGVVTADMVVEILVNGADPATCPVRLMDNGIVTVNTETAEAIHLEYSMFEEMASELKETITAEEFE
ncbi:MAG: ABC transporter substrate-binding protein [Lachnospiraceae bacterium]|nr:ABC transporter substrate-binding protein [Lachnospiraceae bacterium]